MTQSMTSGHGPTWNPTLNSQHLRVPVYKMGMSVLPTTWVHPEMNE